VNERTGDRNPVHPLRLLLAKWDTMLKVFVFKILRAGHIRLQHKVELMQQKITKMMEILFIVYFMKQLKVEITALVNQTFTA